MLVAFEAIHHMKTRPTGKWGVVALKIDISKVYDRMQWDYLLMVMTRMGLDPKWVAWIRQCITIVTYSISRNEELIGPISPRRGLRQGTPCRHIFSLLVQNAFRCLLIRQGKEGQSMDVK